MNKIDELNIEDLRVFCRDNKIKWTIHALKRIRERKILPDTVIDAVLSGNIVEQYKNDKYYPSCLIFNEDYTEPLHAVVSTDNVNISIITAYVPTPDDWESDFKTRKENE